MDSMALTQLINKLVSLPKETEWVEFKHNFHSEDEIGQRLSALSNSASLLNKPFGYLVFGVEDETQDIIGTTFRAKHHKKGNEELEMWLLNRLNPRIDIECFEFDYNDDKKRQISMYRVPAATDRPVTFLHSAYIRVGSLTKQLIGYPEKEAKLWKRNGHKSLDKTVIKECKTAGEIISLLSAETYFDRLKIPMPQSSDGIIERFISEKFIVPSLTGYGITELGAILLAKDLRSFDNLYRKAIRVIVYKDKSKVETIREKSFEQGYAVCFANVIDWVNGQLPANEEIGKALREEVRMYPEIAIREISANQMLRKSLHKILCVKSDVM